MQFNRWVVDTRANRLRTSRHNIESLHGLPRSDPGYIPLTSYALCTSVIGILLNDSLPR